MDAYQLFHVCMDHPTATGSWANLMKAILDYTLPKEYLQTYFKRRPARVKLFAKALALSKNAGHAVAVVYVASVVAKISVDAQMYMTLPAALVAKYADMVATLPYTDQDMRDAALEMMSTALSSSPRILAETVGDIVKAPAHEDTLKILAGCDLSLIRSTLLLRLLFYWAAECVQRLPAEHRGPGLHVLAELVSGPAATPPMIAEARKVATATLRNTRKDHIVQCTAKLCAVTAPEDSLEGFLASACLQKKILGTY